MTIKQWIAEKYKNEQLTEAELDEAKRRFVELFTRMVKSARDSQNCQ